MGQAEFPVGIEEELQLLDPESGVLRGRTPERAEAGGPAGNEPQRTTVGTGKATYPSAWEAGRRLAERRLYLNEQAAASGLAIAAIGLHPIGPGHPAQAGDPAVPGPIAAMGDELARESQTFGLHVHVAVPDRETAVRAMCGATPFIPHLLALSASSPFHQAQDTTFESFRMELRDMSPRAGPPLPIISAAEYGQLETLLAEDGPDRRWNGPIAWDIRPSGRHPILEFRFLDANPWTDTIELLAAMARALTAMYADRPAPLWSGTEMQLIRENRWRAARFGLSARLYRLDPITGETRSARDSVLALAERLAPVCDRLGDGMVLDKIDRIVERGTAASVMRQIHERGGSIPDVIRWAVEETRAATI